MTSTYQLKITLADIKPSIWRRVLVPATCTLKTLHDIIQALFEWEHAHLYQFELNGQRLDDDRPKTLEQTLKSLELKPKQTFRYTYDFGDDWEHIIVLEKIIKNKVNHQLPHCLDGQRAGPPEDCGGAPGYAHLIDVLSDDYHPEFEDMCDWIGGDMYVDMYLKNECCVNEINSRLAHM